MKQSFLSGVSAIALASFTLAFSVVGSGCQSSTAVDLLGTGQVEENRPRSKYVELYTPNIWVDDGVLTVSGVIHRLPLYNGPLTGHVDVIIRSEDKKVTEVIRARMSPPSIPFKSPRRSSYLARSKHVPPPGSSIEIVFANDEHPESEASTSTATHEQSPASDH